MINKQKLLGLLGICAKAGAIVSGTDACMEAIDKKKIKLILVAEDASSRTKEHFKIKCDKESIPIIIFANIDEISKPIGKKNKAVIGIKNKSLSDEIIKNINGGVR